MEPNPHTAPEPEPAPQPIEPSHTPGQVIGPSDSLSAGVIGPEAPTVISVADAAERPMGVVMPEQSMGGVINGQVLGQNDSNSKPRRRIGKKPVFISLAAVFILLGGSAAAYFGYAVPNKPENVLASALKNSLAQHQFTTVGTIDLTTSGVSSKVGYTVKADADKHSTDSQIDLTISGVKIPLNLVTADGNAYFKVGDLSTLESVLNGLVGSSSDLKILENQINSKIANQWIEIDSTLIKEAKLSCLTDYPAALNQSDITALEGSYKKNSFAAITSRSLDTVDGKSAYKYQLQIDDNKSAAFNPATAGYFKKLSDCLKNDNLGSGTPLSSLKDGDKTPLTLWVDKKTKTIVKYASQSTTQDKTKNNLEATLSGTISYGKVDIKAPANSKPLLSLLGDLNFNSLLGDAGASSSSSAADTERKTDINALHGQIEAYWAQNGYYPTLIEMNDTAWRVKNLKGLASEALKDPAGSKTALASTPAAHVYSYQALPAGCDNIKVQCNDYTLTATLDAGGTYVKQSLNTDNGPPTVLN